MISGIGFLTSFCFLHTNMHHLYYKEWEEKWTYLVLERWRWWRCCVLCFTVSSASVRFASVSPALPYSSSFSSLDLLIVSFFFFSSPSLPLFPVYFVLPLSISLFVLSKKISHPLFFLPMLPSSPSFSFFFLCFLPAPFFSPPGSVFFCCSYRPEKALCW